jgi:glycosyltransferase A (GT-A) superfamily protein (DUF2064 family)
MRLILVHVCAPADERWRKPLGLGLREVAVEAWHRLVLARTLEAAGELGVDVRVHTTGSFVELRALAVGRVDAARLTLAVDDPAGAPPEQLEVAMKRAFADGYTQVVAIPGDVPELTAARLHSAFAALDEHDAVIGPASDGGSYLVGLEQPVSLGSTSAAALRVALTSVGRTVAELPPLADVDAAEAALALAGRVRGSRSARDRLLYAALADLFTGVEPPGLADAFLAFSELDALAAAPTVH